jgi:hypothetical protein
MNALGKIGRTRFGRALTLLGALTLAACGGGGAKSPDFTSGLESISVSPTGRSLALGESAQYRAYGHYTAPPGGTGETRELTSVVDWSAGDPGIAEVSDAGVALSKGVGDTTIRASFAGLEGTGTLAVGAPVIKQLIVRGAGGSSEQTISLGQSTPFTAYGLYTDGVERLIESALNQVRWSAGVGADLSATAGTIVTATGSAISAGTPIKADLYSADGSTAVTYNGLPISGTATLVVTAAAVSSLKQIQWSEDPVPGASDLPPTSPLKVVEGATRRAVAIGVFTDGSVGVVAGSQLDWNASPADGSVIAVDALGNVTGAARGPATLGAALKANSAIAVTRAVEVVDEACQSPARQDRFVANGWFVPVLCLICSVNEVGNVIDADDTNYATLTNNVALLGGETAVNLSLQEGEAAINTGPAPKPVSFLIAIDQGTFPVLNLGLFNQLYISLHSDPDGVSSVTGQVAASGIGDGGTNALELTLLGLHLVPGLDTVKVSFTPPAGVEYRRLRLGNNAGVVQANLSKSVRVSAACLGD